MTRKEEFEEVKRLMALKENLEWAECGLFFIPSWTGDSTELLFKGDYFALRQCSGYCYYDVFGCNAEEEKELMDFYKSLDGVVK